MNKFDLNNRTAVITGGAQGFGLDIAKKFLNFGAKVIIWDIDEQQLQITSKEINNSKLSYNKVDVSNFEQVNNAVLKITSSSNIDILIKADDKRENLKKTSQWLRNRLAEFIDIDTRFHTPIVPLVIGRPADALRFQKLCINKGILVGAVRPPTVPKDSSRIRISLNSELSQEKLDPFISIVKEWSKK